MFIEMGPREGGMACDAVLYAKGPAMLMHLSREFNTTR